MAFRLPYFIGFLLLGGATWYGMDLVRMRTAGLDRATLAFDLADLLEIGVPLNEAMARLNEETQRNWRTSTTALARAWRYAAEQVQRGSTLGAAIGRSGKRFPPYWAALLASTEATEDYPRALRRLGELEVLQLETRRHGTLFPKLVAIFVLGMLFFLTTYIWPTFFSLYEGMSVQAPTSLRGLTALVKFLRNSQYMVVVSALVLCFWYLQRGIFWRWNRPKLLGEQARLAGALAGGAELGLSVPRLLELGRQASGSNFRRQLQDRTGPTLGAALRGLLPDPWIWLVEQAEGRQQLAETLHMASRRLVEEQQRVAHRWNVAFTQTALLLLGTFVGAACLASMAAITNLTQLVTEAW